ncbi:S8 family serine peptidase [Caviibacter abscessus]|uniref:S8 family serine peptidase n=1 Tax=Caviibacter abscessus TaxID=1766719 RepID=UPI000838F6CE|nr:S8 family serine peptidase [Caviibacter abscessus]
MNIKKISNIIFGVVALTSCSTAVKNDGYSKPTLVMYKEEDTNLSDYTKEYDSKNFEIRGPKYVYKGEQFKTQYIDSETVVYKTKVELAEKVIKEGEAEYSNYPDKSNEQYTVRIEEIKDPKDSKKTIKQKVVFENNDKNVKMILKSTDTGKEREVNLTQKIKVIDPLDVFNKQYPGVVRYTDLKKGLDNGRISLDVASADGLSRLTFKIKDTNINKYEDLDDMVGEHEVLVRIRVDGFASERDVFVKKKVYFGEKLEDYKKDYSKLLSNLDENSLRFSKDGKEVLGGFNEEITSKLLANENKDYHGKNTKDLAFVTKIIDEDPTKPTVGNHKVVRQIIENGKVVYQKYDESFVGFNGPTVLVTDNSFFDLSPEIERRTYRQTPYYSDPKFNYIDMNKNNPNEYAKEQSKLERTHGATVIGSMIDELSYGDHYWWRANTIAQIGKVGKDAGEKTKQKLDDKKLFDLLNGILESLEIKYPDKVNVKNVVNEIRAEMEKTLKPAIEGKMKPIGQQEQTLTEEQKKKKLEKYYDFVLKKGLELRNITEVDKIPYTDINFHVISMGKKDGRSVDPVKSGKYIAKALEENKNIKIVNMSYGSDQSFDEYVNLDTVSDENVQKAADYYNQNPLYRFLIQAWLKAEDDKISELIRKRYTDAFDATTLYNYFKNKETITAEDFKKLIRFKKYHLESALENAPELIAANNDVLFVRALGNTYSHANVDLTTFKSNGQKRIISDPNLKYNNNLGSIPSMLNYIRAKEAEKEGKEYKYDYTYRKNLLGVVGVSSKSSFYGSKSTDDFWGYGIGTGAIPKLKNKDLTPGMYDMYISLVKKLNEMRKDPTKYPKEEQEEVENQIKAIESFSSSTNGKADLFSLTRAGSSKLWSIAAEGEYAYVSKTATDGTKLDDDKNFNINFGSSFATPRVTAVAAKVQSLFPWMTAHQIKQTILTTAKDDFRIVEVKDGKKEIKGIYGVDENIGWGLLDKEKAYKGPARFVKALTHETGSDYFNANIKSGVSVFSNDIAGGFSVIEHMLSRGKLPQEEITKLNNSASQDDFNKKYADKLKEYLSSLSFEERELFFDAGLEKTGKGTLILAGKNNTYTGDTNVKEGTLVIRGGMKSNINIFKGAKLKLDINYEDNVITKNDPEGKYKPIDGEIQNAGSLYSYSNSDTITKKYLPYTGSKTYVSPISKLSIGALDLRFTDDFTIDIFQVKGISNKITQFKTESLIFEAKANATEMSKVRLGIFPVSEKLSLKLEYKDGYLKGTIMKGGIYEKAEDKRSGGDKLPYLSELEKKLEETRKKLDEEAEKRRKEQDEKNSKNKKSSDKPSTNTVLATINSLEKQEGEYVPTALSLSESMTTEMLEYKRSKVSDALDAILYAKKNDIKAMNGQTLVDSLSVGFDVASLNKDISDDILKVRFTNKKVNLFTQGLTDLTVHKDIKDDIVLKSHLTGGYLGVGTKMNDINFGIYGKYLNGSVYNDDIQAVKLNSIGIGTFMKLDKKNVEFDAVLSTDVIYKKVVKDVLYENRSEYSQNQYNLSFAVGLGYRFNINNIATIKPKLTLDNHLFVFDKYKEQDSFLGLQYDLQAKYKVCAKIGIESNVKFNDKLDLDLDFEYSKWITNTKFDLKVSSSEFTDIQNTVNTVKLKDNEFKFKAGLNIRPTNKLNLNINYTNKNIKSNKIGFGLNYVF